MKINYIEFENYKSFKDFTKLRINKSITTIIGKNESGKSNLINLIGSLSTTKDYNKDVFNEWNRSRQNEYFPIKLFFKIDNEEALKLNVVEKNAKVTFSEKGNPTVDGFFTEYFSRKEFIDLVLELKDITKKLKLTANELTKYNFAISNIEASSIKICYNFQVNIQTVKAFLKKTLFESDNEKYEDLCERLSKYLEYFNNLYDKIPIIFKYSEKNLKNAYRIEKNFLEKYSEQPIELKNLITASKIDPKVFMDACNSNNSGLKEDLISSIKENIEKYVSKPFNEFYKQEKIDLVISVDSNILNIFVRSDKQNINFSERSNGLKWYLNLFIELKANDIEDKSILFLLDEPGVYLHIDAQKYLLDLFQDLSTSHQIIYTTHSPFMIKSDYLEQIRPVFKHEGNSKVFNSIQNPNISGVSQQETYSPIAQTIGINMASSFSIYSAPFSIITEGKLDAKYLCAFNPELKKDFKFISCIGAQNIVNVATILFSWQSDFLILLDDDNEGRNVKNKLLGKGISEDLIVFVSNGLTDNESDKVEIENLISDSDFELLGYAYNNLNAENKSSAALKFQEFMGSAERGNISLETINNFRKLIGHFYDIRKNEY